MASEPARSRPSRPPMVTAVRRVERLSASMIRIVVTGEDLNRFQLSAATDSYVKVMYLDPDSVYERPIDVDQIRATMPREAWPRMRTYTVRAWDSAALELTLDFVTHGDEGLAGPWAQAAQIGDEVLLLGPGGEYRPDPAADWHLMVGDESALPAIAASLEELSVGAVAQVLIEVHGPADEIELPESETTQVTWVHRGDEPVGSGLVDAVTALEFPGGDVHAFVHGEAGFVRELRRHLLGQRGIVRERVSISGYWRLGADDEVWRQQKRAWNQAIEDEERTA